MSELVRVQLPDGDQIWARIEQDDGLADVAWKDSAPVARLDDLAETVRAVATSVRKSLVAARPDDVSVEFGIELAVKSGKDISVLTEVAGKASLRVTLSWGRDQSVEPPAEDEDPAEAASAAVQP